jgi:hypothetical protein
MSALDEFRLHDFPDRAIRRLLEHPHNLREVVAEVLPDIADRFDFDHVEPVRRDFLMEDWRRRESDLLFRLPFRGDEGEQPVLVCLLVEHQSGPDAVMPLRVLIYAVLYWEREWKAWEDDHQPGEPLRLSPVVPIVFHTGSRRWRTNRTLAQLMAGPRVLRRLAPRWPILFWDLAAHSPQDLLEGAGDWLRALAVVRAEEEETETFTDIYGEVLRGLEALAAREKIRWSDLMEFVLSWAFRRRPRTEIEQLKKIAAASHKNWQRKREIRKMSKTLGQTWEEWAEQRKAEGKAEGRIQTRQEDIRLLLEERFGEVPDDILRKIEGTTDADRLNDWFRQAARARSLDELRF